MRIKSGTLIEQDAISPGMAPRRIVPECFLFRRVAACFFSAFVSVSRALSHVAEPQVVESGAAE
jgi:hypothetical protein